MKKSSFKFFLLLLVLGGCCRNQYKGQISLTELQRAVNPFNGNEVLKFIDNNADTIIYSGQGREHSYERHNARAESCEGDYDLESDITSFTSTYNSSRFCINLTFSGDVSSDNGSDPVIYFQWTKNYEQSEVTTFH